MFRYLKFLLIILSISWQLQLVTSSCVVHATQSMTKAYVLHFQNPSGAIDSFFL